MPDAQRDAGPAVSTAGGLQSMAKLTSSSRYTDIMARVSACKTYRKVNSEARLAPDRMARADVCTGGILQGSSKHAFCILPMRNWCWNRYAQR